MIALRLLPCGPRAVLAEVDGLEEVLALAAALRAEPLAGVVDLVPAERTLLVHHRRPDPRTVEDWTRAAGERAHLGDLPAGRVVEIRVRYDGADLDDVAAAVRLPVDEVVRRHQAVEYVAAFCGFQPGFAYLIGLDPALHLPRRATPRTRVPAGSVAIAARYTGVYPQASPGGWHLLGTTDATLWDDDAAQPALVEPGDRVRFVAS